MLRPMIQAVILTIYGRVQNVGFRYFVIQQAEILSIRGYVKNQSDGSVYIEAEGETENLLVFVNRCSEGPVHAHVTRTDVQDSLPSGFVNFTRR